MISLGVLELLALALLLAPAALLIGALALIVHRRRNTMEAPRDQ